MVFLLVNWKLSLPNTFISPSEQMGRMKTTLVILTCYSLTDCKKKKIASARLGVMWRSSFLQCRNWERLKRRDFHIIGEVEKRALEFISWLGYWQVHNGEEKAVIIQWHSVPVWDSRQPKQGGCGGPEQHPWQPRLSVSQVGTSRLPPWWPQPPNRCCLESPFLIPGGRILPGRKRRHSPGPWAGGF